MTAGRHRLIGGLLAVTLLILSGCSSGEALTQGRALQGLDSEFSEETTGWPANWPLLSLASMVVKNVSNEPVTLTSVEVVGGDDQVKVVGYLAYDIQQQTRKVIHTRVCGFPPPSMKTFAAQGAVLESGKDLALIVGLDPPSQQRKYRVSKRFRITYTAGASKTRFVQELPKRFIVEVNAPFELPKDC